MTADLKTWKIDVTAYLQMVEVGIIDPNDPVELLDGKMIEMSPAGPPHLGMINRITTVLSRYLQNLAIVQIQSPILLSEDSLPEPDIAILRLNDTFYADAYPQPEDVHVLIEVSDTSLAYDRDYKLHFYAEANIREYWIVDLSQHQLLRYYEPQGREYRHRELLQLGEEVNLVDFDLQIPTLEFLGPSPK